jgi:predicted secreted protein
MPSFLKPSWKVTFVVTLLKPFQCWVVFAACAGILPAANPALAQTVLAPQAEPLNIVRLDATVFNPIKPDTVVMTMVMERSGPDAAAPTQQVNKVMADAVREAKATSGVEVSTGNFSTQPQYDNKGNVIGWTVRAELVLKGRDFAVVGQLAGNLATRLKLVASNFEVSRELRAREDAVLLTQALKAFQVKAELTAQTLGFKGYSLREINIQKAQLDHAQPPRAMMMARAAMADAPPVQVEAGQTAIHLTVAGSIQLK